MAADENTRTLENLSPVPAPHQPLARNNGGTYRFSERSQDATFLSDSLDRAVEDRTEAPSKQPTLDELIESNQEATKGIKNWLNEQEMLVDVLSVSGASPEDVTSALKRGADVAREFFIPHTILGKYAVNLQDSGKIDEAMSVRSSYETLCRADGIEPEYPKTKEERHREESQRALGETLVLLEEAGAPEDTIAAYRENFEL